MLTRLFLMMLIFGNVYFSNSQTVIHGSIRDIENNNPLAYVNVGINKKNIGTTSLENGRFSIKIPNEHLSDTLSFSIVGYEQLDLPILKIIINKSIDIRLKAKAVDLNELKIVGNRPVEKKYGIRKRGGPIHFTDGMFSQQDIFEIGQLIKIGNGSAQITSVNLYIASDSEDSASFRINFYRYHGDKPSSRIIEKRILQRRAIKKGWLRFDISDNEIFLSGDFVVAIECIPNPEKTIEPLTYEIKLGGSGKSFYRRNSLGQWNTLATPLLSVHYCLS